MRQISGSREEFVGLRQQAQEEAKKTGMPVAAAMRLLWLAKSQGLGDEYSFLMRTERFGDPEKFTEVLGLLHSAYAVKPGGWSPALLSGLMAAAKASNVNIEQLGTAVVGASPFAKAVGAGVDEQIATLSVLAATLGKDPQRAQTAIRAVTLELMRAGYTAEGGKGYGVLGGIQAWMTEDPEGFKKARLASQEFGAGVMKLLENQQKIIQQQVLINEAGLSLGPLRVQEDIDKDPQIQALLQNRQKEVGRKLSEAKAEGGATLNYEAAQNEYLGTAVARGDSPFLRYFEKTFYLSLHLHYSE